MSAVPTHLAGTPGLHCRRGQLDRVHVNRQYSGNGAGLVSRAWIPLQRVLVISPITFISACLAYLVTKMRA